MQTLKTPASKGKSAQSAGEQIRDYLAASPAPSRKALERMREIIRAAAPGAVESFSYRIPGFKLDDRPLVWYAAFKNHTSLYPIGDKIRGALADDLEGYETSKGTVRFPLSKPLPAALVRRLVKARIAEVRKGTRG